MAVGGHAQLSRSRNRRGRSGRVARVCGASFGTRLRLRSGRRTLGRRGGRTPPRSGCRRTVGLRRGSGPARRAARLGRCAAAHRVCTRCACRAARGGAPCGAGVGARRGRRGRRRGARRRRSCRGDRARWSRPTSRSTRCYPATAACAEELLAADVPARLSLRRRRTRASARTRARRVLRRCTQEASAGMPSWPRSWPPAQSG